MVLAAHPLPINFQIKLPPLQSQLKRERPLYDKFNLAAGIKDLNDMFDQWQAMKKRSESNADVINNEEPEWHNGK